MRARLNTLGGERWLLFLLALAIATALWFSVKGTSRQVVLPGRPEIALRTVPVIPALVGTPGEGFAVTAVEIRPQTVTLTGPRGMIEGIETVYTAEVNIRGASEDVMRTVQLDLPSTIRSTGPVTVTVRIGTATSRRTIPRTRVVLQGLPDGLQATADPAEVAVEVEGPPALIGSLRPADLMVVVEAAQLTAGRHQARPQVQPPAGVRVVALQPPVVAVTVRRLYP